MKNIYIPIITNHHYYINIPPWIIWALVILVIVILIIAICIVIQFFKGNF